MILIYTSLDDDDDDDDDDEEEEEEEEEKEDDPTTFSQTIKNTCGHRDSEGGRSNLFGRHQRKVCRNGK